MRRHIAIKERTNPDHHAVTTVLGVEAVADDLGHHRQGTTKAQSMEEPEGPELPPGHTTRKTMKKRWERRDLLIEFAPHQYPKVSNCLTISKNTMDPRSRNHGSQITYRQRRIQRGASGGQATPSVKQPGPVLVLG
jgi:hypothetical protein